MGYYAERHGSKQAPITSSGRSYYRERHLKEIPKSENILERAVKVGAEPYLFGQEQPSNLLMRGISSTMQGLKRTPGLGPYMQAHDIKSELIENPLLDIATDPETYLGGAAAVKGVRNIPKSFRKQFGSEGFGKKINKLQSAASNKRVDYSSTIQNAIDDPVVKKVIDKSGILEKYGGRSLTEEGGLSDNLSKLTLQESQDIVNALKSGVRQGIKEGIVKPTELGLSKLFSSLSKAQDSVFPAFKKVRGSYRFYKKAGKATGAFLRRAAVGATVGAAGTAAGTAVHSLMKGSDR